MNMEKEITDKDKGEIRDDVYAVHQSYSGPLPPSSEFARYKEILPSAPERILAMAEEQQKHQMQIDNKIVDKSFVQNILGMIFAFVIVLSLLFSSVYLAVSGFPKLSLALIGITVSLAYLFITRQMPKKEDKEQE